MPSQIMRYLTAAGGMTNVHRSSTAPALRSRLVRIDSRGKIADRRFRLSRSSVSKIEARLSYVDGQGTSLCGGNAKSTGTITLSDPTTWQSNLRFHRETRDDAILTRRFLLRRNGRGPTPQKSVTGNSYNRVVRSPTKMRKSLAYRSERRCAIEGSNL
jgi:hypothetical protein